MTTKNMQAPKTYKFPPLPEKEHQKLVAALKATIDALALNGDVQLQEQKTTTLTVTTSNLQFKTIANKMLTQLKKNAEKETAGE